ncbi:MAG: proline--tRNA ligase [Chloroflexi bacterium]|nr:proline--tRNA ligase [Chloroflexota bacterium]
MRLSHLLGRTERQVPAEAETVSHQFLLKAGLIHQVASGVYAYLPLAWRSLQKIAKIMREEMDAAGGQEMMMPTLQPREMWEESGRAQAFGQALFAVTDRRGRPLILAPTHEEVVTDLARRLVRSYRDLPIRLYHIQTKFRDEPRPRGGLIRVREFHMKDLYSLDADEAGLDQSYQAMVRAYRNIFIRCGLEAIMVEADSGAIGGKESHEFMLIADSGEDEVLRCPQCDYAANAERASFYKEAMPSEDPLPPMEVATPGVKTISELAAFLGMPQSRTLKAVFYSADGQVVLALIRGDYDVNEVKLKNLLKCADLRLAEDSQARAAGLVPGSASAVGLSFDSALRARSPLRSESPPSGQGGQGRSLKVVADDSIALGANFVAGANKPDFHLRNVNYPRDFRVDTLADIAQAKDSYPCPRCRTPMTSVRGIEVGHVFKLGDVFSQRWGAGYLDRDGVQRPIVMGCYGIGLGRLLAAAIEQHHDERGIIWPVAIAPYHIYLCALGMDNPQVAQAAEDTYHKLTAQGLEVLYDDRQEPPGVKFNDADLLGLPIRVVLSPRTLKESQAEVKKRWEDKTTLTPLEKLPRRLKAMVASAKKT